MTAESYEFLVDEQSDGLRLDAFLSDQIPECSRSRIARDAEQILVNGLPQKLSRKVTAGDRVQCELRPEEQHDLVPEEVPFTVVYEDDRVTVIDKPAGLVVHPGAGNWSGTLVHGLLYRGQTGADSFRESGRPGIVHRLDKDTSGLIIVARDAGAHEYLQNQFARRTVRKKYVAIVRGRPPVSRGRITGCIVRDPGNRKRFMYHDTKGKAAETEYLVRATFGSFSLVELYPKTGRTHQLRVHMQHSRSPIVGDPVYSRDREPGGLLLHAAALQIRLPGEKTPRLFRSALPERFIRFLQAQNAPEDVVTTDWSAVPPVWSSEDHTQEKST